jgi:hypothetical protein
MASWRERRRSGTGGGPFGDLLEVFQPSRRHVVEETERQRHAAQLPESGAPPLVDLDAGTVVLAPPGPPRPDVPHVPGAPTGPVGSDPAARPPDGDPPP